MKSLKEVLAENHKTKTKAELIQLLSTVQEVIGEAEYQKVSGIAPNELNAVTKSEIHAVIEDLNQSYKTDWENNVANLSIDLLKTMFEMVEKEEALFGAANASSADFPAELNNIPFAKMISGPLNAAVEAQNSASMATATFINEVGFEEVDDGTGSGNKVKKLRIADFSYSKEVPNPNFDDTKAEDPTTNPKTINQKTEIKVPFISILNVPSLRIETVDIDFNVKLNSVFTKKVDTSLGVDASLGVKYGPVDFKVSASYKRSASTGVKVEKQYTMGVKVTATNDEMPAGLEKVLNLLAE
ncbi:MAG: DUF2589 domain-containing protein [Bacteroidota bacterium]